MTLIVNEIHLFDGLNKTMLVAAADRRISKPDGSYETSRKKLFPIPYLNSTISYFGLASVCPDGTEQYLSDWLPSFINKQSPALDLETFAVRLRDALHQVIPKTVLQKQHSGFHIAGYNNREIPEFWHFSNVGKLDTFRYLDLKPRYNPPSSDFLGRDARAEFGWDGSDPSSAHNGVFIYRNGDFRAHVAVWGTLDKAFGQLLQFSDFKRPGNPNEYGEWVRFKFEFIAYLYKKWAKREIIARPIDVIVMHRGLRRQT